MASYRLRIGWSNSYSLLASGGSYVLTGQSATLTKSAAPGGSGTISWTAVTGATGYYLYYDTNDVTQSSTRVNVGNVTSYNPTGLWTGQRFVNVASYDESLLPGQWVMTQQISVTL